MLEFWEFMYMCIFVLVILVLKEIIEYVFITRKGGNVINIEETVSNTKTNEIGTNTRFKKKKGGKNDKVVEGFAAECTGPTGAMTTTTSLSLTPTNCEKATWLFCDDNFDKLVAILNAFTKSSSSGSFDNNIVFNSIQKLKNLANCISNINFASTGHYENKIKLDAHLELVTNTTLFSADYLTTGPNTTYDRNFELQRKFKVYTICTHDMIGLRKEYDQPNDDDGGNFSGDDNYGNIYMLVNNFHVHDGSSVSGTRHNYKDPSIDPSSDATTRYPGIFHCSHRLRVDTILPSNTYHYHLPLLYKSDLPVAVNLYYLYIPRRVKWDYVNYTTWLGIA